MTDQERKEILMLVADYARQVAEIADESQSGMLIEDANDIIPIVERMLELVKKMREKASA